jgi:hypothetical protein
MLGFRTVMQAQTASRSSAFPNYDVFDNLTAQMLASVMTPIQRLFIEVHELSRLSSLTLDQGAAIYEL